MLKALDTEPSESESPFGPHEEEAMISLLLDFPELYIPVAKYLSPDLFDRIDTKYVVAALQRDFDLHGVVPSRALLRDRLAQSLTVDDPYEEILSVVDRKSDPREVPYLRETLHKWTEHKIYELLYTDEAIMAHHRGDHQFLRKIFDDANRIQHSGQQGFWFFDQIDELFADHAIEHISLGFPSLDKHLNDGGPSTKEVLVWLAPTGVGKTLMMCNNAFAALNQGHNVLFVTFELSMLKTAIRIASGMTGVAMKDFITSNPDNLGDDEIKVLREKQAKVHRIVKNRYKNADLVIYELPPEECSMDNIYAIIDTNYKMRGWRPKVVILDYLELMMSRRASANDSDYTRQKSVATEMRGLAKNEEVFVITATQTNRSGMDERGARNDDGGNRQAANINLDKSAESFGKTMPVEYVVSLNQTIEEYQRQPPPPLRLWIAKNRNGPKFLQVVTSVWYDKMKIAEIK